MAKQKNPEKVPPKGASKENAKLAIQIEANKLLMVSLRELGTVFSDKIADTRKNIEALKQDRKATHTFASFRSINAHRLLQDELVNLSTPLREKLTALRKSQGDLLKQIKDIGLESANR